MIETITLVISAHHANHIQVEDLLGYVLILFVHIRDSIKSVSPLLHYVCAEKRSHWLGPVLLSTIFVVLISILVSFIPFFCISVDDLGSLVSFLENLGHLFLVVPCEH